MRRRSFITLLGGAAVWPLAARAQQPARPAKIGVLYPGLASNLPSRVTALRDGLQRLGYRESDNFELILRSADGDPTRMIPLAMELVERKVDVILAASGKGVDAILMLSSPVFGTNPERVAGLTVGVRLPAVMLFPDFARAGGLMAYGVNPINIFRQGATIVAKVLRGSKPGEVPAELPTKFELVINLKTAKRLGIVFPTAILLRADEVIE